tara:strand:+ start:611 stop:859 length:249 start_codon:yes stop_codon:yes gene_type:complete
VNKVLILCLFFLGCTVTHKSKEIEKIKPKQDWLKIYEKEIQIAVQNKDHEARHFFLQEWLREKSRLQLSGAYEWKPIPEYAK